MKSFVDLFAGAGGLSYGFESTGLQAQLAIELNPHSVETYKYNSLNNKALLGSNWVGSKLVKRVKERCANERA